MRELVFPKVELVHHIPCPGHPLGRYVRDRKHVELSRTELSRRPTPLRRFALYHELGHWWRTSYVPDELVCGDLDEEEYADMFALFFVGRSDATPSMRRTDTVFLNTITMQQELQILRFAEEVLRTLEDELGEVQSSSV